MATLIPTAVPDLISVHRNVEPAAEIIQVFQRTGALISDHFALQRDRHTEYALRLRAIARDPDALATIREACVAIGAARWSWKNTVVLSPESAGFFLADEIARAHRAEGCVHAVVQTDLRRRPTQRLTAGEIERGASVVIVNDVSNTGDSLQPMLDLVERCKARTVGVLLLAVVGVDEFMEFARSRKLTAEWLVTARWQPRVPGKDTCPGCELGRPLIPIAEFS